jgi:hypothetical protein
VAYIHNRVLFSHEEEQSYVICRKMGGTRDHLLTEGGQTQKTNKIAYFLLYTKSRFFNKEHEMGVFGMRKGVTGGKRGKEKVMGVDMNASKVHTVHT